MSVSPPPSHSRKKAIDEADAAAPNGTGDEGPVKKARVEPVDLTALFVEQSVLVRQVIHEAARETQRLVTEQLSGWAAARMSAFQKQSEEALRRENEELRRENEMLRKRGEKDRSTLHEVRTVLWREQARARTAESSRSELHARLVRMRGVLESHLDELLAAPELLRALKEEVADLQSQEVRNESEERKEEEEGDALALAMMEVDD